MNNVVDDYELNVIGQCGVIYFPPVMMRWPECDNRRFLPAVRTSARGGSAVSGQCAAAIMATLGCSATWNLQFIGTPIVDAVRIPVLRHFQPRKRKRKCQCEVGQSRDEAADPSEEPPEFILSHLNLMSQAALSVKRVA